VKEVLSDCDNDTLLIKAHPLGPTCHTGADNAGVNQPPGRFLYYLEDIIELRKKSNDESHMSGNCLPKA